MKFTFAWLKDYLKTDHDVHKIAEKLTAIGLETENITNEKVGFIIAKIIEVKPHPNADTLNICMVDNATETLQIVCGAPNVKENMQVVLASVGTVIPVNNLTIQKSTIRGAVSNGMLCSEYELGMGKEHDSILAVDDHFNIGDHFFNVDPVIDIAITPNRGDCLGVHGIARDLAAAGMGELPPIKIPQLSTNGITSPIDVRIENEDCALIGCYIQGVKNTTSPIWLQERLQAIGLKPISVLVDITNYLTISLNGPMHIYDVDKINGQQLTIRKANAADQEFTALNDKNYQLGDDVTVIADNKEIQAIAGIIGGKNSGCEMATTNIFLEIALFDKIDIAKSSRQLAITTDASYRFERGIDGHFMLDGMHIAVDMITGLCGGQVYELSMNNYISQQTTNIPFNLERISKISGMKIEKDNAIDVLTKLGFVVQDNLISPPSWRHDIDGEADIAEEILRINGYDKIPSTPLPNTKSIAIEKLPLHEILMNRGMHEVITWSFMDENKVLDKAKELLKIENPIADNLNIMRPSIIPNLIEVMSNNFARDEIGVAVFELGPVYSGDQQEQVLSGLRSGMNVKRNIYGLHRECDIFDAKADVLEILAYYNIHNPQLTRDHPEYYHPGRSGCLRLGKTILAYFGELIERHHEKYRTIVFEVFIDRIPIVKQKKKNSEFSVYQSVMRDFGFVVAEEIMIEEVLKIIYASDKKIIQDIDVFDVYRGEDIGDNKKSVALSVKFQSYDRTLSGQEIEEVHNRIIDNVHKKIGGILRRDY